MTHPDTEKALDRAHAHAAAWLGSLDDRPVPARGGPDAVADALGRDLPDGPTPAAEVVDLLAGAVEPGLVAMPSGRFFGFVIGGTLPAALAADWLVERLGPERRPPPRHPGAAAVEEVAGALAARPARPARRQRPSASSPAATMANFTGLAAGRDAVLRRAGWDVDRAGWPGAPRVRVLVGAERHDTVDLALRYLGLGAPELVAADDQGRIALDALRDALDAGDRRPTIVALQAGNVHSGAFDPFAEAIAVAHEHGAWVHVDGAFGLWAAAVAGVPAPGRGLRGRRLVGHRRAQEAQRALRLRDRRRARPGGPARRRWACTATT